jgi:hypothetical protein
MNRLARPALISAALASFAGAAQAQNWPTNDPSYGGPPVSIVPTAERFGQPGQLVIDSNFAVDFNYASIKPPTGSATSSTTIGIAPALDFFVARNVSVGGRVAFIYQKVRDDSATTFAVGPEVGYSVALSPRVSLFPRLGAAYAHSSISSPSPIGGSISASAWAINLFVLAPVLFHPFEHFFLGGGPTFSLDLVSKVRGMDADKVTQIGLGFVIGGWF